MNSRSSVNDTNLVNYSTDLSTLNPLDSKDSLLSFPFDHIYACHSEISDSRPSLQLDKEVEITTHCVVDEKELVSSSAEVEHLSKRLSDFESQNKKLKDLLIYHLDLIQQQNEVLTKRDKLYHALKQENDSLKTKLSRMDRRLSHSTREAANPYVPTSTVTSAAVVKSEPRPDSPFVFTTYDEPLLAETGINSYIFKSEIERQKAFEQDVFGLDPTSETDVSSFFANDLEVASVLDNSPTTPDFNMIDNKRSFVKKETKTNTRPEPRYTVTSNSGNPVIHKIQRNRRKSSGIGSMSRNRPAPKVDVPESTNFFDDEKTSYEYSINKKSTMLGSYGKTSSLKRTSQFTGSLSDRLQLIDTTPTGEDPYQLGEADMREQSPIPKLMLQKTNHGRMRIRNETLASRRTIYDAPAPEPKPTRQRKGRKASSTSTRAKKEAKTLIVDEPDLDIVKTEPEIDWRLYSANKAGNETSLCDFSYGETSTNLTSSFLPILNSEDIQDLLDESPLDLDNLSLGTMEFNNPVPRKSSGSKSKKRGARTASFVDSEFIGIDEPRETKRAQNASKRGRKRARSTTVKSKNTKRDSGLKDMSAPMAMSFTTSTVTTSTFTAPVVTMDSGASKSKAKVKPAIQESKSPIPGMETTEPYHTLNGDPDLSWYLGLDPNVKFDDIDPTGDCESTVEVPTWREKPYTSSLSFEGTENMDDKVFEKRHQKLEAEERRQLRWHMRRIREQRHVEKLKQRQRDPWCRGSASSAHQFPAVYTIWPQPQRDIREIEITDVLPVIAFGENLPAIRESDFMLPWMRLSKALKRAKRSKTLH